MASKYAGLVLLVNNSAPVARRATLHRAGCAMLRTAKPRSGIRAFAEGDPGVDLAVEVADLEALEFPVKRCKCAGRAVKENPSGLAWRSYVEAGRPSLAVKAKTEDASGAYAIRRKDSHSVVYVGESRQGHMWRTIARHFQAPVTFTNRKKPGGGNAFATDRGGDYEVAWEVTSRGYRTKPEGDQRALNLQAAWIEQFRAAGHPLKNRDDGKANAEAERDFREARAAQAQADDDRGAFDSLLNPRGTMTLLGLLTRLELATGVELAWSLKAAPWLVYDDRGRLFIVYPGKVERASTPAELKEYKRTHWGAIPEGRVRGGGVAVAPFVSLGPIAIVTYTTRKGTDAKLVDYVHPFGTKGRGRPRDRKSVV